MSAKKFDTTKPDMALLSNSALTEIAAVLTAGKDKYGADNWRGGMEWRRLISAAYRHLGAFQDGQDYDEETGRLHLAHLGCCVMFLIEYQKKGLGWDNRFVQQPKQFPNPPLQDDTMYDNCKVKFAHEPTRMYTKAEVSAQLECVATGRRDTDSVQFGMPTIDCTRTTNRL